MAARTLKPYQQEHVKSQIQTTQLLKRVQKYAHGELPDADPKTIDAAFRLLDYRLSKASPDITTNIQVNMFPASLQQRAANLLSALDISSIGTNLEQEALPAIESTQVPITLAEDSYTIAEDANDIDEQVS